MTMLYQQLILPYAVSLCMSWLRNSEPGKAEGPETGGVNSESVNFLFGNQWQSETTWTLGQLSWAGSWGMMSAQRQALTFLTTIDA